MSYNPAMRFFAPKAKVTHARPVMTAEREHYVLGNFQRLAESGNPAAMRLARIQTARLLPTPEELTEQRWREE